MRSRYAAFALCLPDYLQATHDVPITPQGRRELEESARAVTWLGLTVDRLERGGPADDEGVVDPIYKGHLYFAAKSTRKPGVVDAKLQPVFSEDDVQLLWLHTYLQHRHPQRPNHISPHSRD